MKTQRHFQAFGIFIPAGSGGIETNSCACIVRYDETKGMTFTPGKVPYARPAHGMPIAVSNSYFDQ